MQKPSHLGKIVRVSIWYIRMVFMQLITHVCIDFLTLTYPPNIYIYFIGFIIFIPMAWVGSLIPFFIVITYTMHSPVY